MRRYVITLMIMAVLIGSLFRAADQTGFRLMKMFGTFGIFLFGVVGTLALTRWQSREGLKDTQAALKSLEPDGIITDWAHQGGGRPDYVVVGPGGAVAVCLDDTARSIWRGRAAASLATARERARASAAWLQQQLDGLEVKAALVLTRRPAQSGDATDDVAVLNADQLADFVRSHWGCTLLDPPSRVRITRALRSAS